MKIFITGKPGSGKTTLIKEVLKILQGISVCGFYTEEIREGGERKGFKVITLMTKKEGLLAHTEFDKKFSVGKYGVALYGFERIISDEFEKGDSASLYVIDEVGPMECFSQKFVKIVEDILYGNSRVIGTVKLKWSGLMEKVRNSPSVKLFHLTEKNRNQILSEIIRILKKEYEGIY